MRHYLHSVQTDRGFRLADPRICMLGALFLLLMVISSSSPLFPALTALICSVASFVAGMRVKQLLLRLFHPLCIAAAVILLKTFTGNNAPSFVITCAGVSFPLFIDGARDGIYIAARILGAVSIVLLLGTVMTFTESMAALAWFRIPRGLIEISLFAWRTLFLFYDNASTVYTAQKNRLGYSGMRQGLKSFGSMAGLLTIKALESSHTMTTAMRQRGYDGTLPLLIGTRPPAGQFIGLLLFTLLAGVAWAVQN